VAAAVLVAGCATGAARAAVFQEPAAFVAETFGGNPPPAQVLWLDEATQREIVAILGHRYPLLRLRYWREGPRSAWVLEEIGKEEPITTGIAIRGGHIERLKVLIYRESRGGEVRYPFFTDQFKGLALQTDRTLDGRVDGISGASLSVDALTRLARLALYLDGLAMRAPP
jgi:hypothetical protein